MQRCLQRSLQRSAKSPSHPWRRKKCVVEKGQFLQASLVIICDGFFFSYKESPKKRRKASGYSTADTDKASEMHSSCVSLVGGRIYFLFVGRQICPRCEEAARQGEEEVGACGARGRGRGHRGGRGRDGGAVRSNLDSKCDGFANMDQENGILEKYTEK